MAASDFSVEDHRKNPRKFIARKTTFAIVIARLEERYPTAIQHVFPQIITKKRDRLLSPRR